MVRVMFKFKFIIKNIFYFSFLMFLFILSIFYLDTIANINDIFLCIIRFVIFILIIAILYMINFNLPGFYHHYALNKKLLMLKTNYSVFCLP